MPPPVHQENDPAVVDRRGLCEGMLKDGFVQSYVDFFYLTHRPDPNPDAVTGAPADAEREEIEVSAEEMVYIRDNLVRAEGARRQGDTGTVYASYSALAEHFHGADDAKTAVYFYEKCLEIAKLTNDIRGEMASNNDLGLIYQSMGDPEVAAKYHERHLVLSRKDDNDPEERRAAKELVRVYRQMAERHEAKGDFDPAVASYTKCLESSRAAKERLSEGLANYRLGRALVLLDECHRAIPFLEDYEGISKELGDRASEGSACAALASAYQKLQNDDKAMDYLKTCLEVATETDDLVAQAEAAAALGVIYNKRKDYDKSVEYFEKNFKLCRTTVAQGVAPTNEVVEIARVYLGMARGNQMLKRFVHVVNSDPNALLEWKAKHVLPGRKK